jgi:hypothetical protein
LLGKIHLKGLNAVQRIPLHLFGSGISLGRSISGRKYSWTVVPQAMDDLFFPGMSSVLILFIPNSAQYSTLGWSVAERGCRMHNL